MAINPNTDFTAAAVLTAAQMNRLPRGIVAQATRTTNLNFNNSEDVMVTSSSFTAVANRYYKITYFEPDVPTVQSGNNTSMKIRLTNVTGTVLASALSVNPNSGAGFRFPMTITTIQTFTAGSVVVVGTLLNSFAGDLTASASSTLPALILVEDIGPA